MLLSRKEPKGKRSWAQKTIARPERLCWFAYSGWTFLSHKRAQKQIQPSCNTAADSNRNSPRGALYAKPKPGTGNWRRRLRTGNVRPGRKKRLLVTFPIANESSCQHTTENKSVNELFFFADFAVLL